MVDVGSQVAGVLPSFSGAGVMNFMFYVIMFFLFVAVLGVAVYFIIMRLKFNLKAVIFKKINGRFEVSIRDRARFVPFGTGGDRIFYMKKQRKYQPVPTLQSGRNTYYFFERKDGELINFDFKDFDEQARQMGAQFLDKEMRYARVSLQHSMKERYDKPSFMEKYAGILINVAAITIIMVFLFLIVRELVGVIGKVEGVVELSKEVLEVTRDQIVALNNVKSGGTGLVSV